MYMNIYICICICVLFNYIYSVECEMELHDYPLFEEFVQLIDEHETPICYRYINYELLLIVNFEQAL